MLPRLSEDDKARIMEEADPSQFWIADQFVDPNESVDFHEGMAAGMLLAFQFFSKEGLTPKAGLKTLTCIARFIKETRKKKDGV